MPNCTEEFESKAIEYGRLGRRVIEGGFDGGSVTSDGGVMLLGEVDRKLGLMDAAARCIAEPQRRPSWSTFRNFECAVAAHSRPTVKH